jgi:hypothetical protein
MIAAGPSSNHTRHRLQINGGTTIISITTTTQTKHQKEHCNKTGHITNKN